MHDPKVSHFFPFLFYFINFAYYCLWLQLHAYPYSVDNTTIRNATNCNKYCQIHHEKLKSFIVQSLLSSGIYDSFKPRPHCVHTVLVQRKENDEIKYEIATDAIPINFGFVQSDESTPYQTCVNKLEIFFIAIGAILGLSCLLLLYTSKKVFYSKKHDEICRG